MSLIVAATRHGQTVLGADTGAWQSRFATRLSEPKAFRHGRALLGLCGIAPVSHAIRYADLPEIGDGECPARFVLGRLVPAMREAAERAPNKGGEAAWGELGGLIALDGWLFDVQDGIACVLLRPGEQGAFARGGPEDFARATFATADALAPGMDAEALVTLALEVAAAVSDACLAPFTVLHADAPHLLRRTA